MRLAPLLLLFLASPAFAGLSVGAGAWSSGSNPSAAMDSSVAAGTVIEVKMQESNAGGCATPSVSDSLNGGYAPLEYYNSASGNIVGIYWVIATVTGTPTITVSTSGCYAKFFAEQITGFVGTPTADASVASHASGTSTSPAISASSSFANEILLVSWVTKAATAATSGGSGWTTAYGCSTAYSCTGGYAAAYAIEASPTADNYSATLPSSDSWDMAVAGIYDAPSSPASAVIPPRLLGLGFGYSSTSGGGLSLSGSPASPSVGSAYSAALTPSGGSGSGYACSLVSASPNTGEWLSILPNCTLQGIPEDVSSESVTAEVTDSAGNTATHTFTITPSTSGSLSILTSASLSSCSDNGACFYHVLLKGGSPPYNCNNGPNTQPYVVTPDQWLEFTPTSTGSQAIGSTTCYDSTNASATFSPSVTVDSTLRFGGVNPDTGDINCPPAHKGDYWQCQLIAYGGSGSGYTYTVPTGLPGWASISGGLISGTPTASGNVLMSAHVVDSSSNTANASVLVNVGSATTVSRPSYNSSVSNGFFVLGTELYDPNGHLFVMNGIDRNHFNSADWSSKANGALSGANAVREFFGFGLVDQGENQTPAQMVSQITNEYANNGIVPIVTVWTIPTSFTASISGTTLTVTAVNTTASTANAGVLSVGYNYSTSGLIGSGIAGNTYISSQLTGTGGHACPDVTCNGTTGTYQVSVSQTVGSESMEENAGTSSGYDANQIVGATNMLVAAYSGELASVQNEILINLANEWGTSTQCGAGSDSGFVSTYTSAISTLRTTGYTAPIVVDLPCEGEDYGAFVSGGYAASIIAADPLKNILFSAHLYNTTSTIAQVSNITQGANAVITFNSSASSNPWSALTNFNGTVCLSGVVGMTQINGQCPTVTSFGGSSGAWTLTTNLNTSAYSAYSSGGTVTDGYYYQNRVNAIVASGIPVMVGEFGPPGQPAMCASAIDNQSVGTATLAASLRAAGLSELYWAWDDNDAAGDQTYWSCYFGMTGPLNTSYTAGQYVPSVPSSLTFPGIDITLHPITGLMSGQPPATVLH